MNRVANIVKLLRETSSTNDKIKILKDNKDNELLQKVLLYTYNPYMKYKVTENTIVAVTGYFPSKWNDIFEVMDELSKSNINDKLRRELGYFLSGVKERDEFDLYVAMLLKDLRCNISAKTINKVWKGLIPEFNLMLAESFFKQKEGFINGREFILTTKLDGIRAVIIKENNSIKIYSRQGQLIEGLVEIENEASKMEGNIVLDGELLLKNDNNLPSDELYRATMKVVRKDGVKQNVEFHAFDVIPTIAFKNGKDILSCSSRKRVLGALCRKYNFKNIINVEILYQGTDENKIMELLDVAKANNQEGIMLNLSDAPYECKRSKCILKVKVMQTCDLRVIGFEEGKGNNKGTLGAMLVDYKGNTVGVGSGFKKDERDVIWNNKCEYIGRIAEIQYFEESKDSKTNLISLRFPVFKGWRFDKEEPSYN